MTETAQPETAAESEVASSDAIEAAAAAFKTFDPNATEAPEAPERARDEHGRFVKTAEEIEAEGEAEEVDPDAESHEGEEETDEAADEAQPEAVDLPPSWPSEQAEAWSSLPPETQAFIVEREGQREAAVNAKFQEAANVRKANEAVIAEAQANRQKFIEAADLVLNVVQPQRPPQSMLDRHSSDYDPDRYHLLNAQADQAISLLHYTQQQRSEALAQLAREQEAQATQEISAIEEKSRPALLKDVPDLSDPAKQPQVLREIVDYAVNNGIPQEVFTDPEQAKWVTSAQLHLTWKAAQYDKMMAAKGKVQPKAAKPASPPVKPGVATPKSAVDHAKRKAAMERLDREGSIEAAAALFKLTK